jgi:hypothetical protein
MKWIRALTDKPEVIRNMTIPVGDQPTEVWNEEILQQEDVKALLAAGKIEIIDDASVESDKDR